MLFGTVILTHQRLLYSNVKIFNCLFNCLCGEQLVSSISFIEGLEDEYDLNCFSEKIIVDCTLSLAFLLFGYIAAMQLQWFY